MALSFVTYAGTGSQTNFSVSFSYISSTHVDVYLDGVLKTVTTDYTWFNSTTIQFLVAPVLDAVVRLERDTPNTERLVDFQDAGNLTESDLDTNSNQVFFIAQEITDGFDAEAMKLASDDHWDAESKPMRDLTDPTSDQDAATKAYVDAGDAGTIAEAAAAAASAAAALVSENAAAADLVLTNADVVTTNADVVLTHADVVLTNADEALTNADAIATAADVVTTNADVVLTNADAATTAQDAIDTAADAATTAQDAIDTAADAVSTAADAVATAADLVLTDADQVSAAASAAAAAASEAAIDSSRMVNHKNLMINGCMRISQRETSWAAVANNTFTLDRWEYKTFNTTGLGTITQESVAHVDAPFKQCLRFDTTTADAAVAATDVAWIEQRIEGFNCEHLQNGKASAAQITISFWTAHSNTGTHCVSVRNSAGDRSYVAEYTQTASNTWERHSVTLTLDVTGTWSTGTGTGIAISFALIAGTTYQTTAGAWAAGNFLGTSSQYNTFGTTAEHFRLGQVQVEQNDSVTDFQQRLYSEEMALCQRYFEKSYSVGTAPGSTSSVGSIRMKVIDSGGDDTMYGMRGWFKVQKRSSPTVTWYAPTTGTVDKCYDLDGATNRSVSSSLKPNVMNTGVPVLTATRTAGTRLEGQWTAESEL